MVSLAQSPLMATILSMYTSFSVLLLVRIGLLLVVFILKTYVFLALVFNPILSAVVLRCSLISCWMSWGLMDRRDQGRQQNPVAREIILPLKDLEI